jgi:glucose/arabinose dehydrogenase
MKAAATLLTALLVLTACGTGDAPSQRPAASRAPGSTASPTEPDGSPERSEAPDDVGAVRPVLAGTVAEGLSVPWDVAFLPDGGALVTERDSTHVLAIPAGGGDPRRVARLEQAQPHGEAGVLGIAVSPEFAEDSLIFVYLTTREDNRVVRMEYDGRSLGRAEVVLVGIPEGPVHDGGGLAFGPDGNLYVSTGETGNPELAQDRGSLAGKILKITPAGEPAADNPFPGSPVWTLGHRNVEGLAFDGEGRLWASEFGADSWDELNRIVKGENYGWPRVEGRGGGEEFRDPVAQWKPAAASPAGIAYAAGALWMASLRGERLWRVPVRQDGDTGEPRDFFVGQHGRLRAVVAAPDGGLWVSTSNRDGRGDPAKRDDRILRVTLR